MNVKSWLRRLPQPVCIRLDRKRIVRISDTNGKNKWRDVIDIITLEQPAVLEALDAEGNVTRMTQLQDEEDAGGEKPAGKAPEWSSLMVPAGLMQHFADLYADAYRRGAEQHAHAYELSFSENTKLVTTLTTQTRSLQQSLEAQLAARIEMATEAGGEDGLSELFKGPMGPMLLGAAQKLLSSGAEGVNGKANGKGKSKGA